MNDTMNNDRDDSKIRKQQRNNRWPSKRSSSKLFLSFFFEKRNGTSNRVVLFFTTRFNAFENVWNTLKWRMKKKKVGKICWSNASLLPLVSFLAHDSRRGGSIQLATDLSRPFSSTRWKVGERVVPWMRGEPFWERGDGTSLDEKPARKKMVPKGRRECGVKSGEGWSALNYESTGTTLRVGELSPE